MDALDVRHGTLRLDYAQLRDALREAYRKWRIWRRADDEDKSLLKASVNCTKNGTVITNITMIDRLRIAFRKLGITHRRIRVLMEGEVKAVKMFTQYREKGVFRWVPQLKAWLRDQAYKFWLGTLQVTLGDPSYSIVGLESG